MRNHWERFLDSLDTSGGHIMVLLGLIFIGIIMSCYAVPKGEDIIIGAFGALLGALKVVHSSMSRLKDSNEEGTTRKVETINTVIRKEGEQIEDLKH